MQWLVLANCDDVLRWYRKNGLTPELSSLQEARDALAEAFHITKKLESWAQRLQDNRSLLNFIEPLPVPIDEILRAFGGAELLGQPCTVEFDPCTVGMTSSICIPNPFLWFTSPTIRGSIAFDKHRRVTVVYDTNDDIREWDGQTWTLKEPSPSPGIISRHQMTYDPIRKVIVMFGGWRPGSPAVTSHELWEWDGSVWTQRTSAHAPPARFAHGQAFDESRGVLVIFGGRTDVTTPNFLDDIWEWDGSDWTQRFAPAGDPSPGIRFDQGMGYDALRKVVVVVGGRDNSPGFPVYNDVWDWNGAVWRQRFPQPQPPPFTEPPGSELLRRWAAYDDSRQMMHLIPGGVFHWALVHTLAPEVSVGPTSQQVAEGNPASFSVTTDPPTTVEFQWRKNGVPIAGANTAGYAIQSVTPADQGIYDVEVTRSGHDPYPPCGVVLSPPAALTVIPATPADLNGDGAVDMLDFADFATMFTGPGE